MSTNYLPINIGLTNAENDSQFLADSFRINGFAVNAELPSALFNKILIQTSLCAALAQSMAAKGYTVNDNPFSALVTVMGNLVTKADLYNGGEVLTYSANVSANASTYSYFDLTLTGANCNIVISGTRNFQPLTFIIRQDATGGRTATINALGVGPAASSNYSIPLSTEPNAINILSLLVGGDGVALATGPIQII